MTIETHFTRAALAKRWGVTCRTIDRLRQAGNLSWIDIAGGRGARPIVRFALPDVEAFEQSMKRFSKGDNQCGLAQKASG
jgi:hypothetical protein